MEYLKKKAAAICLLSKSTLFVTLSILPNRNKVRLKHFCMFVLNVAYKFSILLAVQKTVCSCLTGQN
jgi:23S rRNA A2030 N6-methylase RlmJ